MNDVSSMKQINSSVVQGSIIGPSSYSIAESDLRAKNINFWMDKFADDVDLITTLDNYDNIQDEIEHVDQWAKNNNLILNKDKSREMIFRGNKSVQVIPPPLDGITRVNSLKKLGVIFQDKLSMKSHVDAILAKCASRIYALNLLRNHGLNQDGLQRVFQAKVVSRITYASSSWCGMASNEEHRRIDAFLNKSKKFGYYPADGKNFQTLCDTADQRLFIKNSKQPTTCFV